jgi:hypothetical protein
MACAKRDHTCCSANRSEQDREQGNPQLTSQPWDRAKPAKLGMNISAQSVTPSEINSPNARPAKLFPVHSGVSPALGDFLREFGERGQTCAGLAHEPSISAVGHVSSSFPPFIVNFEAEAVEAMGPNSLWRPTVRDPGGCCHQQAPASVITSPDAGSPSPVRQGRRRGAVTGRLVSLCS